MKTIHLKVQAPERYRVTFMHLLLVKDLPANAGDIGDTGMIPGLGRPPGGGMAVHSSVLAWRIPRDRWAWQAI